MTIPQVNAGATDRNREQTKRIVELLGTPVFPDGGKVYLEDIKTDRDILLPNGSFTLDQVVGMLEREHVYFERHHQGQSSSTVEGWYFAQWGEPGTADYEKLLTKTTDDPHDLTAAMNALIKVLETKGGKV